MFGRVETTTGYRTALAVPLAGLVHRGQLDEVFVVEHGCARLSVDMQGVVDVDLTSVTLRRHNA